MEEFNNLPQISQNLPSPSTYICASEISIRNHSYIISVRIDHPEQAQVEIKVEAKESADQWKSTFHAATIEKMTAKTGSFKAFDVFVNMLEHAVNQRSSSVSIDLLTLDDLELLRQNQRISSHVPSSKSSTKRYLILIYNAEYDRIYYPLSLRYCGKPDPIILIEQIRQLATENQFLKSRFQSTIEHPDFQEELVRLRQENETYRQQLLLHDSNDKDKQIEFLRQMIRASEDALLKERIDSNRVKAKKDDRYKSLLNQIESLKIAERQLKLKVKNLTTEINLTNKNSAPVKSHGRSSSLSHPTASDRRRYYSASVPKPISSSTDSHVRFNPTTYVHERTIRLRQIELHKKKETRRGLSSGRCHSDSDNSDISVKSHDLAQRPTNSNKNLRRKRTKNLRQHKSNDSIDSDIERVSSPPILRKAGFNNSTILLSPEDSHDDPQNVNSNSINDMVDIDHRLKSLEKFIKHNFLH